MLHHSMSKYLTPREYRTKTELSSLKKSRVAMGALERAPIAPGLSAEGGRLPPGHDLGHLVGGRDADIPH